jgi:hypothetical protein
VRRRPGLPLTRAAEPRIREERGARVGYDPRVRAALVVFAIAACNGGAPSDPPVVGTAHHDAAPAAGPRVKVITPDVRSLPEPPIALPMTESFRLLDAGAAPRARLRYAWDPKANRELTVDATLTTRRLAGDGTWGAPLAVPTVREGFGVIATPTADGGATLAFRGVTATIVGTPDADARARADEYLASFRDHVEHRRGTIAADARGRVGRIAFADAAPAAPAKAAPDRAIDDVTERWLAASVPLPDEPIGAGARWRVVTVLRAGAAIVKQSADYTLVEARPDRWIVEVDVRRVGEDQLVDATGLPPGSVVELIALFREHKGRVELSPSLPWPIAGTLSTELRVHARIGVPGQGVREDLTEDTGTLTFASK